MSPVLFVLALTATAAVGALVGGLSADWACRRRWRRNQATGSMPLHGRHGSGRRGGAR